MTSCLTRPTSTALAVSPITLGAWPPVMSVLRDLTAAAGASGKTHSLAFNDHDISAGRISDPDATNPETANKAYTALAIDVRDSLVGDAAGHDAGEGSEVGVDVNGQPVHGHPPAGIDPNGRHLAVPNPVP